MLYAMNIGSNQRMRQGRNERNRKNSSAIFGGYRIFFNERMEGDEREENGSDFERKVKMFSTGVGCWGKGGVRDYLYLSAFVFSSVFNSFFRRQK
jgi:hypothetical protein